MKTSHDPIEAGAQPRVTLEAATPAETQSRGAGLTLRAGVSATPFGHCLVAETPRGICSLAFFVLDGCAEAVVRMRAIWPLAEVVWDHGYAATLAARLFASEASPQTPETRDQKPDRRLDLTKTDSLFQDPREGALPWKVHVRGTPFQLAVWRALLEVAAGKLVSYAELAAAAGHPTAVRATGTAVGTNPVAFLIPCHRVILSTGETGQYRWGAGRKQAMINWEKAGR